MKYLPAAMLLVSASIAVHAAETDWSQPVELNGIVNSMKELKVAAAEAASAAADAPTFPALTLAFTGKEDFVSGGSEWTRYKFTVTNRAAVPNELFAEAPDLPPCGLNANSSRTWVGIFYKSGERSVTRLNAFCALKSPEELSTLWFVRPKGEAPPSSVYIVLTDRRTNTEYRSAPAEIRD